MTAVPVTGVVSMGLGRKDSRPWHAWSPVYRQGSAGEVITTRGKEFPVRVVAGVFSAMLEPGVCILENPDGKQYTVTIPVEGGNLWDIIDDAEAFPPDTAAEALAAAVTGFLEDNPVVTMQVEGITNAGTAGKDALLADTEAELRDAAGASEVGAAVFTGDAAEGRTALQTLGLVQAAKNPDLLVTGAITVDGDDLITSAAVVWPDGQPGTLTITARHSSGAVNAYNITYGSPVTKTYTQPTITRNSSGAATNVPAIVVS